MLHSYGFETMFNLCNVQKAGLLTKQVYSDVDIIVYCLGQHEFKKNVVQCVRFFAGKAPNRNTYGNKDEGQTGCSLHVKLCKIADFNWFKMV